MLFFLLYYNLFILNWLWLLFVINLNYILLFSCILGLNVLSLVVICGIFCFGFWLRFVEIVFFCVERYLNLAGGFVFCFFTIGFLFFVGIVMLLP